MVKPRILIVEDEALIAASLARTLSSLGYIVPEPVATGQDAINAVTSHPPDLVLMDIELIGPMNGIETAKKISTIINIPIIYLTAYSDDKRLFPAQLTEPYGYLVKPVSNSEIHATIQIALYKNKLDRQLRDSEEKYRTLFEESFDGLFLLSPGGKILDINEKGISMFGYDTKEEVLTLDLERDVFVIQPDRKQILSMVDAQGSAESELVLRKKSGETMVTYCALTAVKDETGEITSYRGIIRDITGKKRMEEALKKSEEKFRKVFDWANDAILLHTFTADGSDDWFIEVNQVACRLLGYSRDELLARGAKDIVPVELHPQLGDIVRQAQTHDTVLFETMLLCKDGRTVPVESSGHLVNYDGKRIWISHIRDITERKRINEELRESEEKYRLIADNTADNIWIFDMDLQLQYISPSVEHMRGFTVEEALTLPLSQHLTPASLTALLKQFNEEMELEATGTADPHRRVSFETEEYCKDGSTIQVENVTTLLRDETGRICGILGISRDITLRKQAERELARVNRALRLLSNSDQALVHITDEALLMNEICLLAVETGGYRMACIGFMEQDEKKTLRPVAYAGFESGFLAIARMTWAESEHGHGPGGTTIRTGQPSIIRDISVDPAFNPWRAEALKRGYQSVIALPLISDGRTFGALGIYARETDAFDTGEVEILKELAGDLAFGIIALRTRAMSDQAEEKIRNLNAYNRSLIEASLDPLVTISHDGKIQDVNTATEMATGRTRNELIGSDFSEYFTDPQRAREGYLRVFSEGKVIDYPLEIRHLDGHTIAVLYNAIVYRDKDGNARGVFAAARDITERKKIEGLRESLIRDLAKKNVELDLFTYTVSHDLKSPLLSIQGFLSLLKEDLKSGDFLKVNTDISRIAESAEKLEYMITTLLNLSRSGKTVDTPTHIPFTDIAREAAGLLDATLQKKGVTLLIPDNMPVIYGDRHRLLLVMTNLLDNAMKFMGDRKEPRIEIGVRDDSGVPVFFVQDNGMGIKKDDQSKVFALFKRLNMDIPGTGIGLATVKRIIEAHGGKIWVESEGLGMGAMVCFTLPMAK